MDKTQALHKFWSTFLTAYDENTVPDEAAMPYITYEVSTAKYDEPVALTASLWYRSTSWAQISQKADDIARFIGSGVRIPFTDGLLWITQGSTFAQRMGDDAQDNVRRIVLNIQAEFETAY